MYAVPLVSFASKRCVTCRRQYFPRFFAVSKFFAVGLKLAKPKYKVSVSVFVSRIRFEIFFEFGFCHKSPFGNVKKAKTLFLTVEGS